MEANHAGPRSVGTKSDDRDSFALCTKHHDAWTRHVGLFADWTKEQRRAWADHQIAQTRAAYARMRDLQANERTGT